MNQENYIKFYSIINDFCIQTVTDSCGVIYGFLEEVNNQETSNGDENNDEVDSKGVSNEGSNEGVCDIEEINGGNQDNTNGDNTNPSLSVTIATVVLSNNDDNVTKLLIDYLNKMWHCYNQKTSDYIVKTIDDLLELNIMNHPLCIFTWILECCQFLISSFPYFKTDDIETFEGFQTGLLDYFTLLLDYNTNESLEKQVDLACDSDCVVCEYNSDDDFVKYD